MQTYCAFRDPLHDKNPRWALSDHKVPCLSHTSSHRSTSAYPQFCWVRLLSSDPAWTAHRFLCTVVHFESWTCFDGCYYSKLLKSQRFGLFLLPITSTGTIMSSHTNFAKAFGIESIAGAVVFTLLYAPLLAWFIYKSLTHRTHVHYMLAFFCQSKAIFLSRNIEVAQMYSSFVFSPSGRVCDPCCSGRLRIGSGDI